MNDIEINSEKIKSLFGNEFIEKLGTYEQIVDHMESLYKYAYENLDEFINISVKYSHHTIPHVDFPKIKHNIKILKFIDIFRVYGTDDEYILSRTKCVTNWIGIVLDEKARTCVTVGNILKIAFYDKIRECNYRRYFNIIYKISENRFLASIENMYGSSDEDIVISISSECICEIPIQWKDNESFQEYDKSSGTGFITTEISKSFIEIHDLPIHYDDVVFDEKI